MKRCPARFWYRFKNWFRTKPGMGEPLRFLCGSEEELRRVTTWVCHCRPQVFADGKAVVIAYGLGWGATRVGGYLYGVLDSDGSILPFQIPDAERQYSVEWCSWIYEHNTYQGTEWAWDWEISYTRRSWHEKHVEIQVIVQPPSAHERAESLLSLSEWLEGKVSAAEKRELLQLPEDVEV